MKPTLATATAVRLVPEHARLLGERVEQALREQPRFRLLADRLLRIGGAAVVPPLGLEEDLGKLLSRRPRTWTDPRTRMMKGEMCRCHSNTAALWHENEDKLLMCTGYALSEDGLWRQHSWCWWQARDTIVETTTRRVAYFGFVMGDQEADRFYYDNCI